MARKAGLNPEAIQKASSDLSRSGQPKRIKGVKTPNNPASANKKVHTGRFVNDDADYDEDTHDFGPMVETAKSSRVAGFRYDFANRAMHVTWRDGGRAYMYSEVPYEIYLAMVRAPSKGKFINSTMNSFDYRKADPSEMDAPSNGERVAPGWWAK